MSGEHTHSMEAFDCGNVEPLRFVLDQLPGLLWTTDRNLVLTSLRGALLNELPVLPEEHLGQPLADLLDDEPGAAALLDAHRRVLRDEPQELEQPFRGRTLLVRIRPLRDPKGGVVGAIAAAQDITERKRTEQSLRENDVRFRRLAETVRLIPWEADPETFRFTYVGPQALEILGYPLADWTCDGFWEEHIHPEDRDWAIRYCAEHLLKDEQYQFEYRMIAADGRTVWVHDLVHVVRDLTGPRSLRGFMIDITSRMVAEQHTEALLEVARTLTGTLDFSEILKRVEKHTTGVLPCDAVATFQRDPESNTFRMISHHGGPEPHVDRAALMTFAPGTLFGGRLSGGKTVVVDDVAEAPSAVHELMERFALRALMATPLFVRGRVLGTFVAFQWRPLGFSSAQVNLFESIARHLALALETSELYEAQRTDAQHSLALAHVAQEVIQALRAPDLLDQLTRLATEALHADFSHIFLFEPAERVYMAVAGYGDTPEHWEEMKVLRIPPAVVQGILAKVEQEGVAQIRMDQPQSLLPAELPMRFGITSALYASLGRGGEMVGVLTIGYRGRKGAFSRGQMRLARGIANLASLALDHSRLLEQLERANRVKSDFVATMSHELRTPLNVILGYNDLLMAGEFGPVGGEQLEQLRCIDRSARSLLGLINATLDLNRLERGQVTLDLSDTDMVELLQDVEHETEPQRRGSPVQLRWSVDDDAKRLHTDRVKLAVVLKNLIGNAFKFTDQGEVRVTCQRCEGGVEITIADTGMGIPREKQEIIFEPFRQIENPLTRRYSGVGLGLYIVQRFVDMLDGTIRLQSTEGEGTTFAIWLPMAPDTSSEAEHDVTALPSPPA